MDNFLVSVIIPTFNRQKHLSRAIISVLSQTYSNWELIIVDDGSTDRTKFEIQKYLNNRTIRYYFTGHKGVCHARNFGIRKSRGRYIALLDSDDEYCPRKLETQIKSMVRNHALLSISNYFVCIDNHIKKNKKYARSGFLKRDYLINRRVGTSASLMMFHKSVFANIQFDEHLPSGNDFDFLLRGIGKYGLYFEGKNLSIINKTMNRPRISTNFRQKIIGYNMISDKIINKQYILSEKESNNLLSSINYSLGIFSFLIGEAKTARKYIALHLKREFIFSPESMLGFCVFILSYSPVFSKILIKFSKYFWSKGLNIK